MKALDLAAAAEALAGVRFRLHGRDPETGLDCIGLLSAAMSAAGRPVRLPNGYRLRARSLPDLSGIAGACGFATASDAILPGDVVIARPGPCQFHLLIALAGERFVHAHAGLGRVVVSPRLPDWPIAGHWRLSRTASWRH